MKGIAVLLVSLAAVAQAVNRCPVEHEVGRPIKLILQHELCNKFYTCAYGNSIKKSCPSDLLFNTNDMQCDWPRNVDCGERNSATELESSIQYDSESKDIELQENGCPVDLFVHWLKPSTTDCNAFYQCVWGNPVHRTCAPGLHFNPVLQVCDYAENAGCVLDDNDDENESDEIDSDEDDEDDDSEDEESDSEDEESDDSDSDNEDDDPNRRYKYQGVVAVGVGVRFKDFVNA